MPPLEASTTDPVFAIRLRRVRYSALGLEVIDHPLIFVAGFAQLLNVLLGDFVLALWSSFKQLKARRVGVPELPLAPLLLALEILDQVQAGRLTQSSTWQVTRRRRAL